MNRYKIYINGVQTLEEFVWLSDAIAYANRVCSYCKCRFQSVTIEVVQDSTNYRFTTFNNR